MMANPNAVRVLDVGQCALDHGNISRLLKDQFGATVDRAASYDQVFYMAGFYDYQLVLVNRIFDADGSEGLELIRRLKTDPATRDMPVMMVSNYPDAQAAAQEIGAVPGFGKATLEAPATIELLSRVLGAGAPAEDG
jgi:CheY-like chemotaxis protein